MTRLLAGQFDPRGRAEHSRLAGALEPHAARTVTLGPLRLAYSGPEQPGGQPQLCWLDGFLDDADELREQLGLPQSAGAEQLIAAGWRRWGGGLPGRLRGDFVLLLWDPTAEEGLLVRDQLGQRPLFLHHDGACLYFASELRHLLALLPRRPAPDATSLAHWLTMSSRPGNATLYEGIRRLSAGATLALDRSGVREERYWEPRFAEPLGHAEPQLSLQVRAALDRAVRRRLDGERRTGVLMSGGLDSSSVAAAAAERAPGRVAAYSAAFPDHPSVDEGELIAELRQALRLPGVTAEVRPGGLLASAIDHLRAWQVPLISWGDFWMTPLLRAAAAEGTRIVLAGDGGDELFGARAYLLADSVRQGHPLKALGLIDRLPGAGRFGRRDKATVAGTFAFAGALPYRLHALLRRPFTARQAPSWMRPRVARALAGSADPLAWKRLDGPRWWASVAHGLTRGIEEIGIFEHQRRLAASAGLEMRQPLLDLDLVELGLRQPPLATFERERNRPVLRAAMTGSLPDTVRLRPYKAQFDAMLLDCIEGSDARAVRALLTDTAAELGAYVELSHMRSELFESDRLRREQPFQWMWQIWRLVTAECWLRAQQAPDCFSAPRGILASEPRVVLRPATPAMSTVESA